jgi:hypothetical protein
VPDEWKPDPDCPICHGDGLWSDEAGRHKCYDPSCGCVFDLTPPTPEQLRHIVQVAERLGLRSQ